MTLRTFTPKQLLAGLFITALLGFLFINARPIDELMAEYRAIRASTISLIASLPAEALERGGTQIGIPVRARAFVYLIPGHELYHLRSIHENYG